MVVPTAVWTAAHWADLSGDPKADRMADSMVGRLAEN